MSLHSHVNNLNDLGSRLANLADRARHCADALEGSRPEPVRDSPGVPVPPVSPNLDAKFSHVCRQYDEVINQLFAQIDRIEQHVIDMPAGMTTAAKSVY